MSSIKQDSDIREKHEIETVQEEEIISPLIHDNNISSLKEMSPEQKVESSLSQHEKIFA